MNVAVIQFPGSNCDRDAYRACIGSLGVESALVWHKETSLDGFDAVILPGGFSYGDYLRCGAIARFSPVMAAVQEFANGGGSVLGICNGFQILCECGLLPGALLRNDCLKFICRDQCLVVEDSNDAFCRDTLGEKVVIPIAHGEGNYRIDDEGLAKLEENKQILFRYSHPDADFEGDVNPNGSVACIAGIRNEAGNVYGMMPHPERVVEDFHTNQDGIRILDAFLFPGGKAAS